MYVLTINPLGFRQDLELHFAELPTKAVALRALSAMIATGHEAGDSFLARSIEAVDQHGLPKLQPGEDRARLRWEVPAPPAGRWAQILLREVEVWDERKTEVARQELDESERPQRTSPEEPDADNAQRTALPVVATPIHPEPAAVFQEAPLRTMPQDPPLRGSWSRAALANRCESIVANISNPSSQARRLGAGLLAGLLWDITARNSELRIAN